MNKYNVAKLQKIQNALCRIVFRLEKTSHVTPYLQKLHWLPISYRILFKYNLITFKAIKFSQPSYLSSLIKPSSLTRGNRLSLSSVRPKKAIGRRGFAMASPTEWNGLPQLVRSQNTIIGFRSQLKTYLFRLAYPPHHSIFPLAALNQDFDPACSSNFSFCLKCIRGCCINFFNINDSILFYFSDLKETILIIFLSYAKKIHVAVLYYCFRRGERQFYYPHSP